MNIKTYGLLPTPVDERDFKLGDITRLPDLSELPKNFLLKGFRVKDQKDTDFCTQFMACGMSELQEGVELCPEWAFAVSKKISGDPEAYGADLRTALSVHTKYGAVESKECPYSVENRDSEFLRRIENYDDALFTKAITHFKKSYIKVTGQYDVFDNIRATLWKYRSEKRAVGSGVIFGWSTEDFLLDEIPYGGGGHAIYYAGWGVVDNVTYLVLVNSYGKKAGKGGTHYVSREVVNHFGSLFGAYMFLDMSPSEIKRMIKYGITDSDTLLIQFMKKTVFLLTQLLNLKKNNAFKPMDVPIYPIDRSYFTDHKKVSQRFLEPNTHYRSGVHPGVDFRCPIGTQVVAPFDGEVINRYSDHPTLGCAVYFKTTLNGTTYYMRFLHLLKASALGTYKKGQPLGFTGNSGDSTGPHLHHDVWRCPIDVARIRDKSGVLQWMIDPIEFYTSQIEPVIK